MSKIICIYTHTHTHIHTSIHTYIHTYIHTLEKEKWNIEYTWIKAHAGHYGNELADKLAKKATRNRDRCYNKSQKVK